MPTPEPLPSDPSASSLTTSLRDSVPRAGVVVIVLAALVIAAAGLHALAAIVGPAFLAINLVIAVSPLHQVLSRIGVPRAVGAVVCLLLIFVLVTGLGVALALAAAQLASILPSYGPQFQTMYSHLIDALARFGIGEQEVGTAFSSINPQSLISTAQGLLSSVLNVTSLLVFLLTVLVFLAMDLIGIPKRIALLRPVKPSLVVQLKKFAHGVRKYWGVSAIFGFIVAVIDTIIMVLLQIPLAPLWGILIFITNFIPMVGIVIGVFPPALLGLLVGGPETALFLIIGCVLVMVVVQMILQPQFAGDAVGITATVSFLALSIWTIILGPLGALIALPATLFVKSLLIDSDPQARWLNAFISSNPERDVS